jgi:AraC family transcriptional regulator, regulatory protein of adaptative response / DNA-3-methyladenine glycosylase II
MLGFLQARAIAGVEIVDSGRYLRTVDVDETVGSIEVTHLPDRHSLGVGIHFANVRLLPAIVARMRGAYSILRLTSR